MKIRFRCNGELHELEASPVARLLDVLREELRLTGTKEGCGEGECGACTVLVDGRPANACLLPAAHVADREVVTIEGLARDGRLSAVQEELIAAGAAQCGICTPGIAVCATAALAEEPAPDRERVRELLAGNLCRCTGYQKIIDAVVAAAARRAP